MLHRLIVQHALLRPCLLRNVRPFTACSTLLEKPLPPRPKIIETDIEESFLKGSGPGGQKINKTSSAVQLKHIPTGIVVKCQETRSRPQNRKLARGILAEKIDQLEKGDESRTAIKTERARAKKASANKKSKRKYRLLAEEKGGEEGSTEKDGVKGEVQGGGTDVDEAHHGRDQQATVPKQEKM